MASPLTMYIQIKQDADSQKAAEFAVQSFTQGVEAGLNTAGIVHYATLALVPNPAVEPGGTVNGYLAILLMTDFDLAMTPYLQTFWEQGGGIKDAISAIGKIAFNPVPIIDTLTKFVNFINSTNLTPAPEDGKWKNFYQAYSTTVYQIKNS